MCFPLIYVVWKHKKLEGSEIAIYVVRVCSAAVAAVDSPTTTTTNNNDPLILWMISWTEASLLPPNAAAVRQLLLC